MAGKGKAASHFKKVRVDGLPEVHFDYCFMSTEGSPLATILVAKEREHKMIMATVVPMKGGFDRVSGKKGIDIYSRYWFGDGECYTQVRPRGSGQGFADEYCE